MSKSVHNLTDRTVKALKAPGYHLDGDRLYLVIDESLARRWMFKFTWNKKKKEMGLGGYPVVSLAAARDRAQRARELIAQGINPIEARKAEKDESVPTFGEMADRLVDELESQWRNAKHVAQWRMTLTTYTTALRPKPIDAISTDDVLGVLRPIWNTKAETASRLRGRIERVLDAAKARGLRSGENPARWKGHLDQLLPTRQKLSRGHHKALPRDELPEAMAGIRARGGMAPWALEFLILTAARTSEVLEARWSEIDLDRKIWTVPASRMKAGREHRVPLSPQALAVLARAQPLAQEDGLLFPAQRLNKTLSNGAMERVLDRMKIEVTVHGFRSTFRDWVGERTEFPGELAEAALAHVVGDATERAYRRSDALERRRTLMTAWGDFCDSAIMQPAQEDADA